MPTSSSSSSSSPPISACIQPIGPPNGYLSNNHAPTISPANNPFASQSAIETRVSNNPFVDCKTLAAGNLGTSSSSLHSSFINLAEKLDMSSLFTHSNAKPIVKTPPSINQVVKSASVEKAVKSYFEKSSRAAQINQIQTMAMKLKLAQAPEITIQASPKIVVVTPKPAKKVNVVDTPPTPNPYGKTLSIMVDMIPRAMNLSVVKTYFSRFGKIACFSDPPNNSKSPLTKFVFIKFEKLESVDKVLGERFEHF